MDTSTRTPGVDTTDDVRRVHREVWERLGPEGRLRQVFELSEVMQRLAFDRIAAHHPELDERGIVRRYIRDVHGVDVDQVG